MYRGKRAHPSEGRREREREREREILEERDRERIQFYVDDFDDVIQRSLDAGVQKVASK